MFERLLLFLTLRMILDTSASTALGDKPRRRDERRTHEPEPDAVGVFLRGIGRRETEREGDSARPINDDLSF